MYGREIAFCSIGWTIAPPVTQFTQCKGKLTTSDLLTKKETTRELRSIIPALQAGKVSWLTDPPQVTENTEWPLFNSGR